MAVGYISTSIADTFGKGITVLDVDTQGAWELYDHSYMRDAFPKVYSEYKLLCYNDPNLVGTAKLFDEGGYRVVLLFTRKNRNEQKDVVLNNFSKCIFNLMNLISSELFIYSPIIGRRDKVFNEMVKIINDATKKANGEAGRNWFICREKP